MSTFCKECGGHFKIDKSKSVATPQAQRVKVLTQRLVGDAEAPVPRSPHQPVNGARTRSTTFPETTEPPAQTPPPARANGNSVTKDARAPVDPEVSTPTPGRPAEPKAASNGHATTSAADFRLTQAVKKPGAAIMGRHRSRKVRCFDCDYELEVTYAAKMAKCPACETDINLNDYEINKELFDEIATRGNVTINKLGALTCEKLVCHDLKAFGRLSAEIDCTGDVMIRHNAQLPGNLHCHRLMVGRDARVQVAGEVVANEMQVDGHITADSFHCSGNVTINDHGAIHGPLVTRSVSMDNGGSLNGTLQILQPPRK